MLRHTRTAFALCLLTVLGFAAHGDPGLTGSYYNNENLYGTATRTRVDPNIDFVCGDGVSPFAGESPLPIGAQYWSATWEGWLYVPYTEAIKFKSVTDDGFLVYYNPTTYPNAGSTNAPTRVNADDGIYTWRLQAHETVGTAADECTHTFTPGATLTKGYHRVRIDYFEDIGASGDPDPLHLYWAGTHTTGSDSTYQIIPANYFTTSSYTPTALAMNGTASGSLSSSSHWSTFCSPLALAYANTYSFTVSGPGAQSVAFTMSSSAFAPALFVQDASGNAVASNVNPNQAATVQVFCTLPPGTYSIEASSSAPRATGAYTLSAGSNVTYSSAPAIVAEIGTNVPFQTTGTGHQVTLTATDGQGGTAYDLDSQFTNGSFSGYVADTLHVSWSVSGGSVSPSTGTSVIWTTPSTAGTYTITMTASDDTTLFADDTTVIRTKSFTVQSSPPNAVDLNPFPTCPGSGIQGSKTIPNGTIPQPSLDTTDAVSFNQGPGFYSDYYTFTVPSGPNRKVSISADAGSDTNLSPVLYLWGSNLAQTVSSQGSTADMRAIQLPESNNSVGAELAPGQYTVEVTSFYEGQTGPYSLTLTDHYCDDPIIPPDPTNCAYTNTGHIGSFRVFQLPGATSTWTYFRCYVTMVPQDDTEMQQGWGGIGGSGTDGQLTLTSGDATSVGILDPNAFASPRNYAGTQTLSIIGAYDICTDHITRYFDIRVSTSASGTVTITASHPRLTVNNAWGGSRTTESKALTLDITRNQVVSDVAASGAEPSDLSVDPRTIAVTLSAPATWQSLTIKRDDQLLGSFPCYAGVYPPVEGDPFTYYSTYATYEDVGPFHFGRSYTYELLTRTSEDSAPDVYTLARSRIVPVWAYVSENQAVDSRVDPRFADTITGYAHVNYPFGLGTYRGGLFVGDAYQHDIDKSRVARSLLKFPLPTPPTGGTWVAGSVNAYFTRGTTDPQALSPYVRVAAIPFVDDNWYASTLTWDMAVTALGATFDPRTAANAATIGLATQVPPSPVLYRLKLGHASTNSAYLLSSGMADDGVLSVALASPDEDAPQSTAGPGSAPSGWAYFAKKEYVDNGGHTYVPYFLGAYAW